MFGPPLPPAFVQHLSPKCYGWKLCPPQKCFFGPHTRKSFVLAPKVKFLPPKGPKPLFWDASPPIFVDVKFLPLTSSFGPTEVISWWISPLFVLCQGAFIRDPLGSSHGLVPRVGPMQRGSVSNNQTVGWVLLPNGGGPASTLSRELGFPYGSFPGVKVIKSCTKGPNPVASLFNQPCVNTLVPTPRLVSKRG